MTVLIKDLVIMDFIPDVMESHWKILSRRVISCDLGLKGSPRQLCKEGAKDKNWEMSQESTEISHVREDGGLH